MSRSGPQPQPQTAALLGWVVREAVTNVVRHSGATRCRITVSGEREHVRLTVTDNGIGPDAGTGAGDRSAQGGGTGLTGLRERLATAGGSLTAGPGPHGGFTVTARLPTATDDSGDGDDSVERGYSSYGRESGERADRGDRAPYAATTHSLAP